MSFAVEGEVPVEVAVVPISLEELGSVDGGIEPLLPFLYLVVKGGEHPYLATLEPDELVGIEHLTVALKAGEVATILAVYTLFHPEWHHAVEEFALVLLG